MLIEQGVRDYVAARGTGLSGKEYIEGIKDFKNLYRAYRFPWGIGEIVTALLDAGLQMKVLKEYPFANGDKLFNEMENAEHRWFFPDNQPNMPLMYAVVAEKPA